MKRSIVIAAVAAGMFALAGTAHAGDNRHEWNPTTPRAAYTAQDGTKYEVGSGGGIQLATLDASDAAHWQICGINVLGDSVGQKCDNSSGPKSPKGPPPALSLVNVDLSDAAHWQICGINVLNGGEPATCS